MNKIKLPFRGLLTVLLPTLVALSAAATVVGTVTAVGLNINEEGFFESDPDNGFVYKCYNITGHTVTVEGQTYGTVAVGFYSYGTGNNNSSSNSSSAVTVPSTITVPSTVTKGGTTYYVRAICKAGFRYGKFTSITLPDEIEEIREEAFAYCEKLTTFKIPYHVTEIAPSTFLDCRGLTSVTYRSYDNGVYSDAIENSRITKIGDHAFDSCVSLESFNCPSSVLYFGQSCFQKCTSFNSFDFPSDPGFILYKKGETNWEVIANAALKTGDRNPNASVSPELEVIDGNTGDYYIDTSGTDTIYKCTATETTNGDEIIRTVAWNPVQYENNEQEMVNANVTFGTGNPNTNSVEGTNGQDYYVDNNNLTIEQFAFADCSSMTACYFEENLIRGTIHPHAFADCDPGLTFSFASDNASPATQISNCDSSNSDWRDRYIRTNNDDQIQIITTTKRYSDIKYEGLSYTIKTDSIVLDSCYSEKTNQYLTNNPIVLDSNHTRYAVITGFNVPSQNITGYYVDGALTIPNRVKDVGNPTGAPNPNNDTSLYNTSEVKVIGIEAFKEKTALKGVTYNESLVQIQHGAFYHCTNLTNANGYKGIDFSKCTKLREISYKVFAYDNHYNIPKNAAAGTLPSNKQDSTYTPGITSIVLPNSVYYLGDMALTNFSNVTSITLSNSLKVMGEKALANLGRNQSGLVDLVLPNTLNDQDAEKAHYYHPERENGTYYPCAIGRHCFDEAKVIASVEMEEATDEQMWEDDTKTTINKNYTCSLGTSCFARCNNLLRFQASENLWTVGASSFGKLSNVKEVFLTTAKAEAKKADGTNGKDFYYPWGINNDKTGTTGADPIFVGSYWRNDLVVYINGDMPGKMGSNETDERWNVERSASYFNDLSGSLSSSNEASGSSARSTIPTYVNVDWQSEGGIIYWKPRTTGTAQFAATPKVAADYNAGIIAFVKKKGSDEYIATRYHKNSNDNGLVDLSNIPNGNVYTDNDNTKPLIMSARAISDHLKTIGDEAFGDKSVTKGGYIVLPYNVETIGERAFYKRGSSGVRIVTYRQTNNSGNVLKKDGTAFTETGTDKFATYYGKNGASGYPYYCILPSTVKSIGQLAFYNNAFEEVSITISSSAASGRPGFYFGSNAFLTYANISSIKTFNITDNRSNAEFVMGTGDAAGGLYYQWADENSVSKKILVYQAMSSAAQAADRTLTLDSDTVAVGYNALARSNYTTVTIPSKTTTLYGGAFQKSDIQTIEGGTGLKYISATQPMPNGYSGTWLYTDIYTSDMPFDITDWWDWKTKTYEQIASRRYAFKDCTSLSTINFKEMTSLEKIGREAFYGCSSLSNMTGGVDTYYYCTATCDWNDNHSSFTACTISAATSKTSGVLDLTPCTNFRSISASAFYGCNSIQYFHTPVSTTSRPTAKLSGSALTACQSKMFFGTNNPDNTSVTMPAGHTDSGADTAGAVFNNSSLKVLVGESFYQAFYDGSTTAKDPYNNELNVRGAHYPSKWYGSNTEIAYYNIQYPLNKDSNLADSLKWYTDLNSGIQTHNYWIKLPVNIDANTQVYYYVMFDSFWDAYGFCKVIDTDVTEYTVANNLVFTGASNGYPCLAS